MSLSLLLFVLALLPWLVALRPGRPSSTGDSRGTSKAARAWLLTAPVLYVAMAVLLYAAESAHLIRGVPPAHRPMRLLARLVYGFGLGFPLVGLIVAARRWRAGSRRVGALLWAASLAAALPTIWALEIEPRQLEIRRYEVSSVRAPALPLRILHVSDLQTDGRCRRERLASSFAQSSEPDLVVFTGDLMNADDPDRYPALIDATHAFLSSLHARLGVYGVLGDWDGWGDEWPDVLAAVTAGTSVRFLRNETVTLDAGDGTTITLHGMYEDDPRESRTEHPERAAGSELGALAAAGGLRIVLAHSPDVLAFDTPIAAGGADLLLAGHTHGGQIVLPFLGALTTHTRLGFAGGRTDLRGMPLIVSRGIGMRGGGAPRARLGCAPEVGWIEVRR